MSVAFITLWFIQVGRMKNVVSSTILDSTDVMSRHTPSRCWNFWCHHHYLWPLAHNNVNVVPSSDLHGCENIRNHINSACRCRYFWLNGSISERMQSFWFWNPLKRTHKFDFARWWCAKSNYDIPLNESYPCQTYILSKQPYVCVVYWYYQYITSMARI